MNEQLEQALVTLINKAVQGADTARDFLASETPEVIQQLLIWHGTYNFILFCIGLLLLFAVIFGNYKYIKWLRADDKRLYEIHHSFGKEKNIRCDVLIGNLFQALWVIPLVYLLNFKWLQIWITPKVWLIEYAAKLLK